jgi:hypothetical protein
VSGLRLFLVRLGDRTAYGDGFTADELAGNVMGRDSHMFTDVSVSELTPPDGDTVMLVSMTRADWQTIAAMIGAVPDKHPCGTRLLNAITTQVGVNADTVLALLDDSDTDPSGQADGTA